MNRVWPSWSPSNGVGKVGNDQLVKAKELVGETARQMAEAGLVVGTWGNVSVRVPDTDWVVITPSGMSYATLKPEDMVVVDLTGRIVEGCRQPSIETPLHVAIYLNRPDVGGVVHTHSVFATACAVVRQPIPVITEELAQVVGGPVVVAEYALPGSGELAHAAVTALDQRGAVLLANHGLVGVGRRVNEALTVCQVVEKAAQILLLAQGLGRPCVLAEADVVRLHDYFQHRYGQR